MPHPRQLTFVDKKVPSSFSKFYTIYYLHQVLARPLVVTVIHHHYSLPTCHSRGNATLYIEWLTKFWYEPCFQLLLDQATHLFSPQVKSSPNTWVTPPAMAEVVYEVMLHSFMQCYLHHIYMTVK